MLDKFPERAAELLRANGVKPSHQRMKVLSFLLSQQTHPTVEAIHSALLPQISTLSKTTVYNTLNALVDAGLVRVVHIEDNETRYDVVMGEHGHFKCEHCGIVYDFEVDMNPLMHKMPDGFHVRDPCPP